MCVYDYDGKTLIKLIIIVNSPNYWRETKWARYTIADYQISVFKPEILYKINEQEYIVKWYGKKHEKLEVGKQ